MMAGGRFPLRRLIGAFVWLVLAPVLSAQTLSSVSVSPTSVVGGSGSTGTVTLSANAPTGGVVVTVSSNNAAATVPASVTVAAGVKTATFAITTSAVTTNTAVTITATYSAVNKTATLTVKPLLSTVSVSPATVVGGLANSTGTVTLNAVAPTGGTVVTLSSNNAAASVPASVTVLSGATTATFTVTTSTVTANATVTITASNAGAAPTATLTVQTLLASVALNQTSVIGGYGATGTVTLNRPAPAGGTVVTLTSSVPARATVPVSITIPAGATLGTFPITSLPVTTSAATTITAGNAGASKTAALTVSPGPTAYAVTLDPSTAFGTSTSTGTVTLNGPAPAGGAVVTLTSTVTTAATVPASVTVPAGATTAAFTISTLTVGSNTTALIKGTFGGVTAQATLTVASALQAFAVTLNPTSVVRGATSTGAVTLNGVAPAGGALVTLTSSSTANATVPASVTVAAGTRSATFTVTTLLGGAAASVNISGVYGGATKTGTLALTSAAVPYAVSFSPSLVLGGNASTGTVTLNGAAPAGGLVVSLFSTNTGNATVPASVTVAAGATSATFAVTTLAVSAPADVGVYATVGTVSVKGTLTLSSAALSGLTVSPTSVIAGTSSTGTVTLATPAAPGGAIVGLTSSNTAAATVPATVTVASGATSATFTVTTLGVASTAAVSITASRLGVSFSPTLTVNPAAISSVAVSPTAVVSGTSSTGTVTLTGKAPPAGAVVTLSSNNTAAATVPASVTVAAQATSATFTVTTLGVSPAATVTITATYASVPKTATLTVNPAAISAVTLSPTAVTSGTNSTGTVTLTGKAPPAGAVVTLSSNNTAAATVPASVTVAAQGTTATFTVTTLGVSPAATVTITATYASVPKTATLTVNPAAISAVSVSPTAVTGGTNSTGTVTLTGKAPPAGAVVMLSSGTPAAATVPVSVTVAAQTTSKTFTITTLGVSPAATVTITATLAAVPKTANLTVNPAALSTVTVSPTSVSGGAPSTGTVTLTGKAPPGGAVVTLASGTPSAAAVPASVTVAAQATTATFTVTTFPVAATVTITATYASVPKTATLTVTGGGLTSVSVSPTSVTAGTASTGTVTLASAAPSGGTVVSLSSAPTSVATVPANVTVLAGSATATFSITTYSVGSVQTVTITASLSGINKTATLTVTPCVPSIAPAPASLPASDTVWVEDALPPGATPSANWIWDTAQKASGTQAHTMLPMPDFHGYAFGEANPQFYVAATDKLVAYVLLNPCDPPREVMIQWGAAGVGWEQRAYWGEDLIAFGTPGTPSRLYMGPLPPLGVWTRLEVPASSLNLVGQNVTSMEFDVFDGQAWFDRIGVSTTCVVPVAAAPSSLPPDTVWVEDGLPAGASPIGVWSWDTSQKASGAKSHTEPGASGLHRHLFDGASPSLYLGATDKLVSYVLINPCDPPREIMLEFLSEGNWEHRAFWGENLIPDGTLDTASRINMGALPAVGQWVRLEVPASAVGLAAKTIEGISFTLYDGQAWWDRIGSTAPRLSLNLSPAGVPEGTSATGTVTLSQPAPAGGAVVSLSSSNTSVATVPASLTIPAGGSSGTFTVATAPVSSTTPAVISASYASVTSVATLTVYATTIPSGELTEGNASSWGSFSSDSAATSVADDTTRVRVGSASLKFVTASGFDTGLRYPSSGDAHWDLTGMNFLTFWLYAVNANSFQGPQPVIVLKTSGGEIRYEPAFDFMFPDAWHSYQLALSGDSYWTRTTTGSPNLGDVLQLEIHHDTWGNGFTLYYDGLAFLAALPGELTEGNAGSWGSFASDSAVTSVTDDSSRARVGSLSVKFVTASGIDTGVTYPSDASAQWDLSGKDHLVFWLYAINSNGGGFQGNQPTLVLKSPSGSFRYEAQGALMSTDTWRLYQVPLAGGGPWVRTETGSPTLTEINQLEIHHDTWGAEFTIHYDGLGFGGSIPSPNLVLSPNVVLGGTSSTGTLTLSEPAPAGGAVANLASSDPAATVPSTATVPAGAVSTTFTVATSAVPSNRSATISFSYGGLTRAAVLTVRSQPSLSSLTISPGTVVGSFPASGTVALDASAPASGAVVTLTSSNPSKASVPASVTIPAGATSATFTVTTSVVSSETPVVITASYSGVNATATLTVRPHPELSAFKLIPNMVPVTGPTSTGRVILTGPAPPGGALVTLSSSNPAAVAMPASVLLPEGASSADFTITPQTTGTAVNISATYRGVTRWDELAILAPVGLSAVTVKPASLVGGDSVTVSAVLSSPTLSARAVSLTSSAPAVLPLPATITIAPFTQAASLTVRSSVVASVTPVTISATDSGVTKTAVVTATPAPALISFTLSPASVGGNGASAGTVTLNGLAPAGGVLVTISGDQNSFSSLPVSVSIPAFKRTAAFPVRAGLASADLPIDVTYGGTTLRATLHVAASPEAASLTLTPASLIGGSSSTGRIDLTSISGLNSVVSLVSSNPSLVGVPPTVTVPTYASSATFPITTLPVDLPTTVTVSASFGGVTKSAELTLTRNPVLSSLTLSKESVARQVAVTATVALNGPAQTGGEDVILSSSNAAVAAVPASVTVPAGMTSASFTVTAGPVDSVGVTSISAFHGGVWRSADLTVTPTAVVTSVVFNPATVRSSASATGTVNLNGPAPAGGLLVSLTSDNPSAVTMPSSVTIPQGAWQGSFTIAASPVAYPIAVAIAAESQGVTQVTLLTITSPAVSSLVLERTYIFPGTSVNATVTLTGPAPPGGMDVSLGFIGNPHVSMPSALSISAGQSSASFAIYARNVSYSECANVGEVYASAGEVSKRVRFYVMDLKVSYIALSPSSVLGGSPSTATVFLNGVPPEQVTVALSSSDPAVASVPASIAMTAQSAQFPVTTSSVASETIVAISVGGTVAANLTVTTALGVSAVSLNPSTVVGGSASTATVTLNAAAPSGGTAVALTSSNASVATVPASVTVPAGASSANFTVTTVSVGSSTPVTVSAALGASSKSATLTVTNSTTVAAVTVSPSSVAGGTQSQGRVTLNSAAPSGGATVLLASSVPASATVPASLVVPVGAVSAYFLVTTFSVASDTVATISASAGGATVTADLTVRPPSPQILGVAPGVALPGEASVVAYGSSFASGTTLLLRGPVYSLSGTATALCNESANGCPSVTVASSISATFDTMTFSVPSSLGTGFYRVRTSSSGGALSNPVWLKVDVAQKAYAAVPASQHNLAPRIYPGQTVTGTFVAGGDTTGSFSDYNDYVFIGTAGTAIIVTLDRMDSSKSWEDPASLDPQLEVIAPDGVVYQNLFSRDRAPGVDLNASLSGAVLPQTGVYFLRAATLKGGGVYRLAFSAAMAPVGASARAIAFSGNYNTVPVGGNASLVAVMLDARGYPLSGATANFSAVAGSDNGGTFSFWSATFAETGWDGGAGATVRLTSVGKVEVAASFGSSLLAQAVVEKSSEGMEEEKVAAKAIPRYRPVAIAPMRVVEIVGEELFRVESGPVERLAVWTPSVEARPRQGGAGKAAFSPKASGGPGQRDMESGGDALTAVPLFQAEEAAKAAITSCSTGLFTLAGVNWAAVNPPFTVTLTDLTPKTGQSTGTEVIGAEGIRDHRIEKTIRLKIDIKDAGGITPPYPVLVNLSVGGPRVGRLILDPDGARIECTNSTFLWHERDAQGNIIALNEEVEYRLGTYAPYVGVVPDPAIPGRVKPVWGTGEVLRLILSTVDGVGVSQQLSKTYKVKPEPGKPDRFLSNSYVRGGPADPVWSFWSDAWVVQVGTRGDGSPKLGTATPIYLTDTYYLSDRFENILFGYSNMTPASPAPGPTVTASFKDQLAGPSVPGSSAEYPAYEMALSWHNDPAMPQGPMSTTLSVTYPTDPEWATGTVSKPVNFQFDRGTFQYLYNIGLYDYFPYGVKDPSFPITVSPGAEGDALPRVDPQSVAPFQTDTARMAFLIQRRSGTETVITDADTYAERSDNPAFKVSLIDHRGQVVPDAIFRVHLCPRFDHFPPVDACNLPSAESAEGAGFIASVRVNPSGPLAPDSRGYMGIELLRAPANPGNYFIKFETLEAKAYRIREFSDLITDYADNTEGAFHFVTVMGGEFLDSSFRRFSPAGLVKVTDPITVYLRYRNDSGTGPATASLTSTRQDGTVMESGVSLALSRVSRSHDYIGAFTANPEGYSGAIPTDKPSIRIALGSGLLKATQSTAAPLGVPTTSLRRQAVNGALLAQAPSAFPGELRLRFLQRNSSCVDESCLTIGGPSPGKRQETAIDPNYNYAEVVRVLVDAVNPHDIAQLQDIGVSLSLIEVPNTAYREDAAKRRLFYQGANKSSLIQPDGRLFDPDGVQQPVVLRNGRAAVTLYAVSTPRYLDLDGSLIIPTAAEPYFGNLKVTKDPQSPTRPDFPLDSREDLKIVFWVDERTYERNRLNSARAWQPTTASNGALDWMEMRALDYYSVDPAVAPEAGVVLSRPTKIKDNWTLAKTTGARVLPTAFSTIEMHPERWWWRHPISRGTSNDSYYHGLKTSLDLADFFAYYLSHEARHSWQQTLKSVDGLTDGDGDFLFDTPPGSSLELADKSYPQNPEFSFLGDGNRDISASVTTALERNAERFAAANIGAATACPAIPSPTAAFSSSPQRISGRATYLDGQGVVQGLDGALVRVERRASGSDCSAATGWVIAGYISAGADGSFNYSSPTPGLYRLTVIPPRECASLVLSACVTVP